MHFRPFFIVVILLLLCLSSPIAAKVASADDLQELEKVRIHLRWKHQFQFAGYYAAIEKGFYADEGLSVELQEIQPGEGRIAPVLDGRAEYGVADASLLQARAAGQPVVLLAQIFQHSPQVFISLRKSGIFTPQDMQGKTAMFDASSPSLNLVFFKTVGSLEGLNIVPPSYDLDDLIDGKVDLISAYLTNEPYKLRSRGVDTNIIHPRSYGIDFYGDNLFTSEKEIRDYPGRAEKVRRATLKGWEYALKHKEEIINLILTEYNPTADKGALVYEADVTEQMISPEQIPLGTIDIGRYEEIAAGYVRLGLLKNNQVPENFIYALAESQQLELTAQEQVWLEQHPRIRFGYSLFPPISFADSSHHFSGISADYLRQIEEKTDLTFETGQFVWSEVIEMARERTLDMFAGVQTEARSKDFVFTQPFMPISYVIITRVEHAFVNSIDNFAGRQVAVTKGGSIHKRLADHYPALKLVLFDNVLSALKAVSTGQVDALIGGLVSSSYQIQVNGLTNLKIAGEAPFPANNIRFAVRKDWPELRSIIDKAIGSMTQTEHDAIRQKWLQVRYQQEVDWTLIWRWATGTGVLLLLVIAGIAYGARRLKLEVNLRTRELAQANRELTQQSSLMEAILNGTTDAVFIKDINGCYLIVNDEVARLFSKPKNEIIGRDDTSFFDEQDARFLMHSDRRIMEQRKVVTHEERIKTLGEERTYLATKGPFYNENGEVLGLFGIARDITESEKRKQQLKEQLKEIQENQKLLRENEERFKTLLENLPVAVALNEQERIIYRNKNFTKLFGYSEEEVVTVDDWWPLAYPDELERQEIIKIWFDSVKKAQANNQEIEPREYPVTCKDGVVRTVEISGNLIGDQFLVTFVDVTERKRIEEEQQNINKLQSIGTLAGGLAHDFNNILAGIYGNITLAKSRLTKDTIDHPALRFINAAEKSMNSAILLTNQLLTFAKGGEPIKESLSLGHLIEEVVNFNLSGSNIKAVVQQKDDLWLARVDQGQMQQVFSNLALNAKQAMKSGGHLYIEMENVEIAHNSIQGLGQGKYVRCTISDEGAGISPENLDRIFEPYFTTKETGSGLGLATVYSIIQRHGGHIRVASKLGKGTTFTIYLPATDDRDSEQLTTESEAVDLIFNREARILIMDDEEMIRDTAVAMLEGTPCSVEAVASGEQAINAYQKGIEEENPFDLVILDLTVPGGVGGREAAQQILHLDPQARIIVSSGYADDRIAANYADYGFRAVLTKPYSLDQLLSTITKVLQD